MGCGARVLDDSADPIHAGCQGLADGDLIHACVPSVANVPASSSRVPGLPPSSAARADPEVLQALDNGSQVGARSWCANHLPQAIPKAPVQYLEPCVDQLPAGRLRTTAFNLLAGMQIHDNSFVRAANLINGHSATSTSTSTSTMPRTCRPCCCCICTAQRPVS